MALNWVKTDNASLARASFLMYGLPGIGKTTLATTLPRSGDDKVIYAAADPGQFVLRGCGFHACHLKSIADLDDLRKVMREKAPGIDWLIIDGLDECGEVALQHFLKTNKDGRAAYGDMATYMGQWTKDMRDLPCNVLFITHIDHETDDAGARFHFPAFPGKQTNKVLVNWFDFVGCLRFKETEEGQQRMIQFKGEADPRFVAKERGYGEFKLDEWEAPDMTAVLNKLGINKFDNKPAKATKKQKEAA